MMSKNSIVPFLKDYLIKFLTRPFLLDTNDFSYIITFIAFNSLHDSASLIFDKYTIFLSIKEEHDMICHL